MSAQLATIDNDLARLRDYIDALEQGGEARLPPEPKLSEQLGVSRSRLRTMLQRLDDEGVIWRRVGKGTFVGPRQLGAINTDLAASISADNFFEARLLLEPQLAAQAAKHATQADILALSQCIAEMANASSFHQWKRLDEKLHRAIADATHNALLVLLYDALSAHVKLGLSERIEEVFGAPRSPRSMTDPEHQSIVEAIRKRNPERAAQLMRDHIMSVRQRLFGSA